MEEYNPTPANAPRLVDIKKAKLLPQSIWTITDVIEPPTDLPGTRLFEIMIRRGDYPDVLVVYTKEGRSPVIGGLLKRMTRPKDGVAAIWSDANGTRASMGGGYTEEALPPGWGTPPKPKFGLTPEQKRFLGIPGDRK